MSDRRLDEDPFVVLPDGMTARQMAGLDGRAHDASRSSAPPPTS